MINSTLTRSELKRRRWRKPGRIGAPTTAPHTTAALYICRRCRAPGSLVSLAPAKGYACADCVKKIGKEALIEATLKKDMAEYLRKREAEEKERDGPPLDLKRFNEAFPEFAKAVRREAIPTVEVKVLRAGARA